MAKRALLRFEDFGPFDYYIRGENIIKLRAIADYLASENIPFSVAVIPHVLAPLQNYSKSIADIDDPSIIAFNELLQYFIDRGGELGMEGYTHQYGLSSIGYEFSTSSCTGNNCPPNDPPEACSDPYLFENSYASSRMRMGFEAFIRSGLEFAGYFITPGYSASLTQRCIIESWIGVMHEDDPLIYGKRTVTIRDTDQAFYGGIVYVPTPLGYVSGANPDASVQRICQQIQDYSGNDLASFFYHPYLELPFIQVTPSGVVYDDNSYLKRLIRCFKQQNFQFYRVQDVVCFSPNVRQTGLFGREQYVFLTGDVNADKKTDFIVWQPQTGNWFFALSNIGDFPSRQNGGFSVNQALSSWAVGDYWRPLSGDFNGDGEADVAVWNPGDGDWQVALSASSYLKPAPGRGNYSWLKPWAVGTYWVPLVGDFNGDGKDDIIAWNTTYGDWQVAFSDGTKFIPQGSWLKSWAIGTGWKARVADFSGNGKDDLLVVDTTHGDWQIALNTGNKFTTTGMPFKPWAADSSMEPMVGNFSGSKRASICARRPNLRNGTIDIAISLVDTKNAVFK